MSLQLFLSVFLTVYDRRTKKKVISIVSSAFLLWLHKMIQVKGQRLQFMNKTEAVS